MSFRTWVNSVLDVLGLIGFTVRGDKKKDEWKKLEGRKWGVATAGFSLSAEVRPAAVSGNEPVKLRLALRNDSGSEVRAQIPTGVRYFAVEVWDSGGKAVAVTAYGRRMLGGEATEGMALEPGSTLQKEIPLSELYDISALGEFRMRASCPIPGGFPGARCESNEVRIIRR